MWKFKITNPLWGRRGNQACGSSEDHQSAPPHHRHQRQRTSFPNFLSTLRGLRNCWTRCFLHSSGRHGPRQRQERTLRLQTGSSSGEFRTSSDAAAQCRHPVRFPRNFSGEIGWTSGSKIFVAESIEAESSFYRCFQSPQTVPQEPLGPRDQGHVHFQGLLVKQLSYLKLAAIFFLRAEYLDQASPSGTRK